jgi:transketolase
MRKQFIKTINTLFEKRDDCVLLLGDIGVHGFSKLLETFPERALNIGVLEQATVGLAAGLSASGFIPIVHTIAPFLVERCFEQIKIDFGYQGLEGNLVSVGASYDYAALGCTHHCPGDVSLLLTIPDIQIFIPGHPLEFDYLFKNSFGNKKLKYYRLSESSNELPFIETKIGNANIVRRGKKNIIIVFGPYLTNVLQASNEIDINIIYYNSAAPLDTKTLQDMYMYGSKVIVVAPFYIEAISHKIARSIDIPMSDYFEIGVPLEFSDKYGTLQEHDSNYGFDIVGLRSALTKILK